MPKPRPLLAGLLTLCVGAANAPHPVAAQITAPWRSPAGVETPAGCAAPKPSPKHHTFYIDAVNGSGGGDGSAAHPWQSLSAVIGNGVIATTPVKDPRTGTYVSSNPNAPVQPGDVILLKSGNYGSILIRGSDGVHAELAGYDNPDFITIEAAPDAIPVLGNLTIAGAGKWIFRGLTIENISPNLDSRSRGALVAFISSHHDIILDGNTIMSQADVSGWSKSDWTSKASDGIFDYPGGYDGASCISIINNKILNVGNGIMTQRDKNVLIKGNTINYFIHDGIDYASNNLLIQNNIETNHIDAGDVARVHPDFMQGQPYGCNAANQNCDTISNLTIDSNIAIRQTDPNLPFAKESLIFGQIQGIDTFDGQWYNVRITNNIVITTTFHGIAYYGVHGAVIANNIVLSDGNSPGLIPWITVQNQKNHTLSSDVVIRNNITSGLHYAADAKNVQVDHNICTTATGKCQLALAFDGKLSRHDLPGVYGDDNLIYLDGPSALFKELTLVDGTVTGLDLRLKSGTPAVGTGNPELAPMKDITGAERTLPFDRGAYKYTPSTSTASARAIIAGTRAPKSGDPTVGASGK